MGRARLVVLMPQVVASVGSDRTRGAILRGGPTIRPTDEQGAAPPVLKVTNDTGAGADHKLNESPPAGGVEEGNLIARLTDSKVINRHDKNS
jgi:hypothetical protein